MSVGFQTINLDYIKQKLNIKNNSVSVVKTANLEDNINDFSDLQGIGPIYSKRIKEHNYSLKDILENPELLYKCGIDSVSAKGIIEMNSVLKKKV